MWLTERGGYLELDFFWWKVFGTKWFNIWWEFSAYLTKRNLLHLHRGWTDEVTQSLNMIYDIICTYCLRARVISQGGSVSANISIMVQDTYICIYVYRAKSIFILSKFKIRWKLPKWNLISQCLPAQAYLAAQRQKIAQMSLWRVCIRGNHVNVSTEVDLKRVVSRTENHLLPISYDLVD